MNPTTTFNYTEEAFLLCSLQEVIKVWARGNGCASFNLEIGNGSADLQLSFKLGHPSDPHVAPPHPQCQPQAQHYPQHRHRRHRGPARREKDRIRATKHQAAVAALVSGPVESAGLILPFTGNIIPLNKQEESPAPVSAASAETSPITSSSGTASPSIAAPAATTSGAASAFPSLPRPHKPQTPLVQRQYEDFNLVKKRLFDVPPAHPPRQEGPLSSTVSQKKTFKMKEDDLWVKLFNNVS
jgi:hypothetical protein